MKQLISIYDGLSEKFMDLGCSPNFTTALIAIRRSLFAQFGNDWDCVKDFKLVHYGEFDENTGGVSVFTNPDDRESVHVWATKQDFLTYVDEHTTSPSVK